MNIVLAAAETIRLVILHSPMGQELHINPQAVVELREPQQIDGHFPKGTKCIVNTADGKHTVVTEDCATVSEKLLEAEE